MNNLNKKYFTQSNSQYLLQLPEKVLQFGTGVLLRGLPDYLIDNANRQGVFNGRVVVVKSTDGGDAAAFERQDNLYTLCIRGVEHGNTIEENVICSAISRVLSAKSAWQEILACAENSELQVIISNTTEVGIELVRESIFQTPPVSFPAKLLAFLHARYQAFAGHPNKGMVIVPTELIINNGDTLRTIIMELAQFNQLDKDFIYWLEHSNHFCNSLVDRIVPGKPTAALQAELNEILGYTDELLAVCEPYNMWAIQGDARIRAALSFHVANPGIYIEPDIERFRELKLRMLNGTHTLSCGLAFLAGFSTVKEAMEDEAMSNFIQDVMLSEIATAIPYSINKDEIQGFGNQVLERFKNPYLEHKWLNISLQYTSKMKMRNVPTLLQYYKNYTKVPERIALGFAAYLLFMKSVKVEKEVYYGVVNDEFYPIQDPQAAFFYNLWQEYTPEQLVERVLSDENLWEADLLKLPEFAERVTSFLLQILKSGAKEVIAEFQIKKVEEVEQV
jgi:tagaturonate reductase